MNEHKEEKVEEEQSWHQLANVLEQHYRDAMKTSEK